MFDSQITIDGFTLNADPATVLSVLSLAHAVIEANAIESLMIPDASGKTYAGVLITPTSKVSIRLESDQEIVQEALLTGLRKGTLESLQEKYGLLDTE